jgi:hypothetical protein
MMIFHGANKRKRSGKYLWLMVLALLLGCDDMSSSENSKLAVNPEHGREIEKHDTKYHVYIVSQMRFEAPITDDTHPFEVDGKTGFSIYLTWPDVPRGQAPGTKPSLGTNIKVSVRPTDKSDDTYEWLQKIGQLDPSNYIIREDQALGLRFYHPIDVPAVFRYAVAMDNDTLTPWRHQPIVIYGNRLSFSFLYSNGVLVVVDAYGRTLVPHWKQIYLGVVKTLDQYAERKP